MKEQKIDKEEGQQETKPEKVESLKVKTNLKAGSDPETPGFTSDTPIVVTGG